MKKFFAILGEKKQALDLYQFGFSSPDIAKLYECTPGIVANAIRAAGGKLRSRKGIGTYYSSEVTTEIIRLYNSGISTTKLDSMFGKKVGCIQQLLKRRGVKIRTISESRKGMKFSEEHLRRLSESHKGQVAWSKGKKIPASPQMIKANRENGERKKLKNRSMIGRVTSQLLGYSVVYVGGDGEGIGPNSRYRTEHRYVAEQVLCRSLLSSEVVHHVNGIRRDNLPQNLLVLSRRVHNILHKYMLKIHVWLSRAAQLNYLQIRQLPYISLELEQTFCLI